jgi:hypothetical protein
LKEENNVLKIWKLQQPIWRERLGMWFASCPQCALAVASTKDASVVHVASFSPSAGCRAARWAPRVGLFIHAVSLPVAKIFSPNIGVQSSMIHVIIKLWPQLLKHLYIKIIFFPMRKTVEKVRHESVESLADQVSHQVIYDTKFWMIYYFILIRR